MHHSTFPYVFIEATYLHVRRNTSGQVTSMAVIVATGVTADGGRKCWASTWVIPRTTCRTLALLFVLGCGRAEWTPCPT